MTKLQQYYQAVNIKKAELDNTNPSGFVYITSDDNLERNSVAGTTQEVTTEEAARQLIQRTAHLSNPAEIAAHHHSARMQTAGTAKLEMDRSIESARISLRS